MNDLPNLPEPGAPGAAAAHPGPAAPGALGQMVRRPLTIIVAVLALMLFAEIWSAHSQVRNLRAEMARRLQNSELGNAETSTLAKAAQEANTKLEVKVGALENRQSEAQSQQLALEQLYRDLSKNRDEWALTEIEQVLSTASQQLQLAGNVAGALIALQNADRSLARTDKPQFITIRRAIARDAEKLKALPNVDSTGIALRLDGVIAQVDFLPMLADERPALPAAPVNVPRTKAAGKGAGKGAGMVAGAVAEPGNPFLLKLQDIWQRWSSDLWLEVRQLIRVRSVETPQALMLSPSQSYFLRENLKLRLLNARLALLSRNEMPFRSDLMAAQDALLKYFDTRAKPTQAVQGILRQVQGSNLAIEMPTLSDSLNAVRNYKAKP